MTRCLTQWWTKISNIRPLHSPLLQKREAHEHAHFQNSPFSMKIGKSSNLQTNKTELILPEWFLKSRVTLAEDGLDHLPTLSKSVEANGQTSLAACQDETGKDAGPSLESQEERTEAKDSKNHERKETSTGDAIVLNNDYEIHRDLYAEARDTILSGVLHAPTVWTNTAAFLLQSPQHGSLGFLKAVVHHIARELKVDLVSLDEEDIHDLCHHFWPGWKAGSECDTLFSTRTIDSFFEQEEEEKKDAKSQPTRMDAFINALLTCAKTKAPSSIQRPPLIVYLHKVEGFIDSHRGLKTVFNKLLEAVKALQKKGQTTIILGTTVWDSSTKWKPTPWGSYEDGEFPFGYGAVVDVSPVATNRATAALARDIKEEAWLTCLRQLRRALRWSLGHHSQGELLVSEALWELPDSADLRETLGDWSDEIIGRLVRQICARISLTNKAESSEILDIIARISRNKSTLKMGKANFRGVDKGSTSGSEDQGGGDAKNKPGFRAFLDHLSPPCTSEEKSLFDCVVDPDSLTSTFESIRLDHELVDRLRQLLSHIMRKSEGLLATETVNGAILYGPPGTGKTHLARILAKEASANFITITPADIWRRYLGETEQRIKTLFSLARKLHPCVIFLDEADGLFSQLAPTAHSWEHAALSEFLVEMDGLRQTDRSPFVLMATNRPGNLDSAVCRRLPHIVHIGLPGVEHRKGILAIFLKEERVAADVNLHDLAATHTRDFSGSDIRALCVQAAMIAQREVDLAKDDEVSDEPRKRVISRAHFRKALEYTRPTVDLETLQELQKFTNRRRGSGMPF